MKPPSLAMKLAFNAQCNIIIKLIAVYIKPYVRKNNCCYETKPLHVQIPGKIVDFQ